MAENKKKNKQNKKFRIIMISIVLIFSFIFVSLLVIGFLNNGNISDGGDPVPEALEGYEDNLSSQEESENDVVQTNPEDIYIPPLEILSEGGSSLDLDGDDIFVPALEIN